MAIERIHSFLVQPAKHVENQPPISGTQVPRTGPLFRMLSSVFDRAHDECDTEIVFRPDEDGQQQNACRDLLVAYAQTPSIGNGRAIAARLQLVTTHRSGLGLLFVMKGNNVRQQQLVISRFPADQGVIAQEHAQDLTVEFIERVFMKSAKAYKSALYASDSFERGFWNGRAIDRQISGPRELSDYWIREFLVSELLTTGPAGTRRLATALRSAIAATDDIAIRHELISAANLLPGQHGRRLNARQLLQRIGLSDDASAAVQKAFPREDLMDEVFSLDRDEFRRNVPYRAVQLDNGALLVAENGRFSDIFHEQVLNAAQRRVRYSTEGRIVEESLRKQQ